GGGLRGLADPYGRRGAIRPCPSGYRGPELRCRRVRNTKTRRATPRSRPSSLHGRGHERDGAERAPSGSARGAPGIRGPVPRGSARVPHRRVGFATTTAWTPERGISLRE